jgi:hypothetical protein
LLHLREHGFSDCILELKFLDGVPPSRTPINHPFVKLVEESARDFGNAIVSVSWSLFVLVVHTNIAELIHQMSLENRSIE